MLLQKKGAASTRIPVRTVVTHTRPHLEELAAIHALRKCGGNMYEGLESCSIEGYDHEIHQDGRSESEWLSEGILFLGVRGGMFDDHPHQKFPNDCVFTLILKHLGLNR